MDRSGSNRFEKGIYWVQTALVSGVLDETDDRYLSMENGADRGPDREARWQDGSEADDRSGTVGIV